MVKNTNNASNKYEIDHEWGKNFSLGQRVVAKLNLAQFKQEVALHCIGTEKTETIRSLEECYKDVLKAYVQRDDKAQERYDKSYANFCSSLKAYSDAKFITSDFSPILERARKGLKGMYSPCCKMDDAITITNQNTTVKSNLRSVNLVSNAGLGNVNLMRQPSSLNKTVKKR